MPVNFTDAQRTAIDVRGRTLLVSAAAGSGKTATLTERIIRELTDPDDPSDISDMLIVTFTRAAAGELRARIGAALSAELARDPGNRRLARQVIAIGNARICTIDSFYLDVVRENFQRLGLPASFRLADGSELDPLRRACMQDVIERFYASDPEFPYLADCLTSTRGDSKLAETLLKIVPRLECLPRGMNAPADDAALLEEESEKPFFESRAGRCALDAINDTLDGCERFFAAALEEISGDAAYPAGYGRVFEYDLATVRALTAAAAHADGAELRRLAADYSPLRLPPFKKGQKTPRAAEIADERADCKKKMISVCTKYLAMTDDEISASQKKTAAALRTLSRVLTAYRDAFRDEKSMRSVCEFSDIRGYAYGLLIGADGEPTETAREWRDRFSEIFVDEYQDTDPVQDAIFRAVARPGGLFMVGDIKQSIYSFRGAEPSIFAGYRRSFPPVTAGDDETSPGSVFMSENFRCSRNIVDFTNAVSSYLFTVSENAPGENGIGYRPEDDLIFSRGATAGDEKVDIALIGTDDSSDDTSDADTSDVPSAGADAEVEYICARIRTMLGSGGYKPGDIAVLSRSKKFAAGVASRLSALGIPAANSVGEDLFANPEVLMFIGILSATDNPQRDIPLAATLKSPVFGFSLDDLVRIRSGKTDESLYDSVAAYSTGGADRALAEKCAGALATLADWRAYAEAMPVDRLIRRIWRETSALTYAGSDKERALRTPTERRANLRRLYEYARKFEASAFRGLSEFVSYINGMISGGVKIESDASSERNAVSIMTIHKSKGLEFPVVFLAGFGARFNRSESGDDICFCPDVGMALKLSDGGGMAKLDTPMRRAVADRAASLSAEEEIRILYVALTRARDKLIITAKTGKSGADAMLDDARTRAARGGRASITGAPSRISWIMTALAAGRGADSCTVTEVTAPSAVEAAAGTDDRHEDASTEDVTALRELMEKRINYVYPYSHLATVPAKLSVSKLYPGALDDEEELAAEELLRRTVDDTGEIRIPSFMGGKGAKEVLTGAKLAAARGTATHLFLQFCDFSRLDGTKEAVDGEAARLVSQGFISSDNAELLRRDELLHFSRSRLLFEIKNAGDVRREQRFNVMLPAAQFATAPELAASLEGEKVLVQGVIDLFFTDAGGKLVLCDYKTDRLSPAEMRDPSLAAKKLIAAHSEQLGYYSAALRLMTGRAPDRITVYSLCLGDTVDIPLPKQ